MSNQKPSEPSRTSAQNSKGDDAKSPAKGQLTDLPPQDAKANSDQLKGCAVPSTSWVRR